MKILKLLIGAEVYIEESDWLAAGWRLWEDMAEENQSEKRDFFLPLPTEGLEGSSGGWRTMQQRPG